MTTTVLDLNWTGRPRSIAAALLEAPGLPAGAGAIALIDPGPSSTLPTLCEHLRARGLSVADLDAVLLTHIHLDHAGATGSLLRENPRIKVFVHSRGAAHMVDPTALLRSAGRLYAEHMDRLFGEFLSVPQENLHILEGGETLSVAGRRLEVLYTPGHASHHVTYFDAAEGTAFVGDAAGICMEGDSFVLPATPPPDINLELWDASLGAIAERKPARLFLTHFGYSRHPATHLERYRERLQHWGTLSQQILATGTDEASAARLFVEYVSAEVSRTLSAEEAAHVIFNGGLQLSWLGLARYHRKRAAAA
jgi:glyoxylase-like metal-dependent hydrolase (beta-lactamase superfamily II)